MSVSPTRSALFESDEPGECNSMHLLIEIMTCIHNVELPGDGPPATPHHAAASATGSARLLLQCAARPTQAGHEVQSHA